MFSSRGRRGETGETLVEVLVAITILGIAGVAIMAGLALSAAISGTDRGQSSSSTDVRNFAEALEKTVSTGGYRPSGDYPSVGGASVTSAKCLTKASAASTSPSWVACPAGSDGGAQMLTLQSTSSNGQTESLTVVVRKPCTASTAADTC